MSVKMSEIMLTENNNRCRFIREILPVFVKIVDDWFNVSIVSYSYKVAPAGRDTENGNLPEFDPFKERRVDHPTS